METTNLLITTPPAAENSSCHSATHGAGGWLSRRRPLVFAGGAIVAGAALALSQHWLTVVDLVPLLFVVPCAVMMFMCMKGGMNQDQQRGSTQASARPGMPIGTDTRN